MSLLDKIFGQVSWKELDQRNASGWEGMLGSVMSAAGESVTPESASRVSAYYRCKANISEAIGMLPFGVYEDKGGYGEPDPKHPMRKLIHAEPNADMTAESFRTAMTGNTLGYGNGYADIERNGAGQPIALHPIHPSRVSIERSKRGDLYYMVAVDDAQKTGQLIKRIPIAPMDMLHINAMSVDGITGMSLADLAAQTLGLRMGAAKYGASFFRNASRPSGVLSHPETVTLSPEKKAELRNSWQAVYGGSENVGRVAVLESGGKFEKISIDPNEAQFLETLDHTDLEICRWFNVPPWKIGIQDQAKGWGTVEATNTHYVQDTLMIWATRWEQEVNRKLLGGYDSGYYSKLNFNAMLRADTKTRSEFYKTMISIGVYSVNDVRAKEDEKPIGTEGDKHLTQLNQTTLDKIGEEKEPEEQPNAMFGNQLPPPQQGDDDEAEDDEADMAKRMRPVLVDVAARIERRAQKEATRLAKKHETADAFAESFGSFMEKYRAANRDEFLPALQALGEGMTASASLVLMALHDDARGRMLGSYGKEATEEDIQKAANVYADAIITLVSLKG